MSLKENPLRANMSELRNAQNSVDALEAQIATLREYASQAQCASEEAVQQLQLLLQSVVSAVDGEVHATMEKFRERTKLVDPVTNEPRFGPKTMAKVLEMLERYDGIYKEVVEGDLVPSLRRQIDEFEARKRDEAARLEELQRQKAAELEALRLKEEQQRQREEQENLEQQQREHEAEQKRIAELARLAQHKREERERQRREEEARIQEEQERLARQNATAETGVEGLKKAVGRLRSGFHDTQLFKKTLQKLEVLIGNVCSSPENAAFRHIPKDNAHFHADIGQFDGGHECLLAMGFKELEPEVGKRVFIMEEPDLSEDFDKWSNWFDGLKEMKSWLEEEKSRS